MIEGKISYEEIPVPNNLSDILGNTKKRYKKNQKRRILQGFAVPIAACMLLFVMANVPVAYASLSAMPVIGSIVKAFHIGSGGEVTDGTYIHTEGNAELLKIWFSKDETVTDAAPAYEVMYLEAPRRLMITLYGVRGFDREEFLQSAKALPLIKDAYPIMYLDDSAYQVVIELVEDATYMVSEYKQPGYLEIQLQANNQSNKEVLKYYVCSSSMQMRESLALMAEELHDKAPSIIKVKEDSYAIMIGGFETKEEADIILNQIKIPEWSDLTFYVEQFTEDARPSK